MSSEQEQIRSIADRIARRLSENATRQNGAARVENSTGSEEAELSALRARLSEIQQRLTHLEAHITHDESCGSVETQPSGARRREETRAGVFQPTRESENASDAMAVRSPWLSGTYVPAAHPSEERFGITEAVSELVEFLEREKTCTVEPGGKPCDHCGMCSARGF
jgi:chromosome segregation ATPase